MKNWAGNIKWKPDTIAYPQTEEEIIEVVGRAIQDNKKMRVIGTGHSFTALCHTNEILMSLDKYQGIISIDKDEFQATVKGGTKLNTLGNLLFEHGMAMENLGDIDVQSIAGTISTGTHGTGTQFGTISTQVIALKFINGEGKVINCSETENQELFKAAQVSLGLFGVITEVTLQCVPAYKLLLQNKKESLPDVLQSLEQRNADNRNFEFYWFPYTDIVWTKTSNIVEGESEDKMSYLNYWSEYMVENYIFKFVCEMAKSFPSKNEYISKLSASTITNVNKTLHSHKVYATQRLVKFREMEYNVPTDQYEDVWKEVQKLINTKQFNIHFPIENRFVKADSILMSPAYQRDSAYIACHVYYKKDCEPYFNALETIFKSYGGRPHWGKMNAIDAEYISTVYPGSQTFLNHRKKQDPDNLFLNSYLAGIFGLEE